MHKYTPIILTRNLVRQNSLGHMLCIFQISFDQLELGIFVSLFSSCKEKYKDFSIISGSPN